MRNGRRQRAARPGRGVAAALARLAFAALTTACLALGLHQREARPEAELVLAGGTLSQSNSLSGTAILSAAGMGPGESASGRVTIANTGSLPGAFSLTPFDVTDTPGRGGGLLSAGLGATVRDVTDPSSPRLVYAGPLGAMAPRSLGTWAPGEQHTFEFAVALPSAAPWLNAVQGSSVSIGYRWDATGAGPASPSPPATPPPTTAPPVSPSTTGPTDLTPFALALHGPSRWRAARGARETLTALCTRACAFRATVRVRGLRRPLALKVRTQPMASAAGRAIRFTIVVPPRAARTISRALASRRRVRVVVTVAATDRKRLTATARKLIRVVP